MRASNNIHRMFLITLLSVGMVTLSACQKAKMTSIPRKADTGAPPPAELRGDDPPGVQTTPPPPPSTPTAPVTPPSTPSAGEGDDIGTRAVDPLPEPQQPVVEIYQVPPQQPVTQQPPAPQKRTAGPSPEKILDRCGTAACKEPPVVVAPKPRPQPPKPAPTPCHQTPKCGEPTYIEEKPVEKIQEPVAQEEPVREVPPLPAPEPVVQEEFPPIPVRKPEPPQPEELMCDIFEQRPAPATNKLDVLFVLDTSQSLDKERELIPENLDRFIDEIKKLNSHPEIKEEIDFQIGVLLANGPRTTAVDMNGESVFGRLYTYPPKDPNKSGAPQPLILNSKIHVSKKADGSEDFEKMKRLLRHKINGGYQIGGQLPLLRDGSRVQGEGGLMALKHFLEKNKVHDNQLGTFPRPTAALMVVFLSDENDVCYDYETANKSLSTNQRIFPTFQTDKTGTDKGITRDANEHDAFTDTQGCYFGASARIEDIREELIKSNYDLPIIVTGALYRNKAEQDLATSKDTGKYPKDNEVGHGYLDLIDRFNSEAVSLLNSRDIGSKLAEMGKIALFKLAYNDVIPLTYKGKPLDIRQIRTETFRVEIVGKNGKTIRLENEEGQENAFKFGKEVNEEPGNPQHSLPVLILNRHALKKYQGYENTLPGAEVRVFFQSYDTIPVRY